MEPVKGGQLVNLSDSAKKVLDDLHRGSYVIRFAAGFPGVMMALSGMSDLDQMRDNLILMQDLSRWMKPSALRSKRCRQFIIR